MDDRLLSLDTLKLPAKTSRNSVDIQWLPPVDTSISNEYSDETRVRYQFDGSASLRFFTCHTEMTGNDIRQYFIEDLFRSMLIRLNLALINMESNNNDDTSIKKLVLPRRVYLNQPVFISAYQLVHESSAMVVDSLQENFKITSVLEDDLEAAEEFPAEVTNEERVKQFNTNINQEQSTSRKNIYQNFVCLIENYFGRGNATLVILLTTVLVLLISIMLKLFT